MARSFRARIWTGVRSGLAGGAAFAIVMKADIALSGQRIDDFQLLAGFGPLRHRWRVVGPIVHGINSMAVGAVYALVRERLWGPGWLRGLTFAMVENTVLWPVIILLDRIHPAIRAGDLPAFNRRWPFIAENLRHAAYGIVLGVTDERLRRVPRASRCSARPSPVLRPEET